MTYDDRIFDELDGLYDRYFRLIDLLPFIDELDHDDAAARAEFNLILAEMTKTDAEIFARLDVLLKTKATKLH